MKNSDNELGTGSDVLSERMSSRSENNTINRFNSTYHQPTEQQRFFSQHTRHLPSRKIAGLRQTKNGKLHFPKQDNTSESLKDSRLQDEENVETIANHIEQQKDLMQDDPLSEMRRLETLRDMAQCLTVKRSIKAKLTHSISQKTDRRVLSQWKRFKYSMSIFLMKKTIATKDLMSSMQLWYGAIKTIEGNFGSGVATYFKFLRWLFIINIINCILSIFFISIPQSLMEVHKSATFNFWDIFVGNGFMENTIFYYGFYTNGTIDNFLGFRYNMPAAYSLTMLSCYTITFLCLSAKVAVSYRKCYIETSGGIHNQYASKIFCSWDYSIASYKTASRCSASIYIELKELLAETKKQEESSWLSKFLRHSVQVLMTIVVLGTIAGTSALLWSLLKLHDSQDRGSRSIIIAPLVVTGIMNIFPVIISQLVKIERYSSKRKALYVNMIRIYAMTVVVISTFLVYWLVYSMYNCWQTELAQEIYRLIIFDFLVFTLGSFFIEALRHKCYTIWHDIGAPKFDIAQNTLNLIYNQILFWVAFYFSPPLSFIIVVKMFLTFYMKKVGLMHHCEPPLTSWRAAQTQTLFLALAFLGMTGTIATIGYVITSVKSNGCGPFQEHEYTWEAIVEKVLNLRRDSQFWRVITFLTKPGFGAAILIAMSMTVYCLRAKAQASKEMVQILREMLVLQSKDKDFLLNEFSTVADEDWLKRRTEFNENRNSVTSPSTSAQVSPQKHQSLLIIEKSDDKIINTSLPGCSKAGIIFYDDDE